MTVESLDGGHLAADRRPGEAALTELRHVLLELLRDRLPSVEVAQVLMQVAPVGGDRGGSEAPFDPQDV